MCGISGIISNSPQPDIPVCLEMLKQLSHRGPDAGYIWSDSHIVMGIRRLSIVNLEEGVQPVFSHDNQIIAVLNGEIYNHFEIKKELQNEGYIIRDGSDAEIIPHAYQRWGMDFASHFNGQFAIAIWDKKLSQIILTRDRTGKKPLFFGTTKTGDFVFGSEIKAIFRHPDFQRDLDFLSIAQVFTFWTLLDSYTPFKGVSQVPCGTVCCFAIDGTIIKKHTYWDVPCSAGEYLYENNFSECLEAFREEISKAVQLRLRADVEVGTYTSGGIDSSVINLVSSKLLQHKNIRTFSVVFEDKLYDESKYQEKLANYLGLSRNTIFCKNSDIYDFFPSAVYHAESPIFRTAPIPMYLLSKKVRDSGIKVILTGEGSDEVTWGYDIYRETKVRHFWSKNPDSRIRPQLFRKMYADLPQFQNPRYFNIVLDFFKKGISDLDDPFYSHATRISNSTATHMYFSDNVKKLIASSPPLETFKESLPPDYHDRTLLEKCQYIETKTLLAGYLLSSQGDRMQNAHGVEGRCPFLDHNVIEFLAKVPEKFKVNGLKDKFILREAYRSKLPAELVNRPKFAYRAPEMEAFTEDQNEYVKNMLNEKAIDDAGTFNPVMVKNLSFRMNAKKGDRFTTRDNLAFIQILSTQILHDKFIKNFNIVKEKTSNNFKKVVKNNDKLELHKRLY
tara:strand:- start:727 stop:2745 length:2019 start_codon:yes stop_codon:yes gene_type:complete